MSFPSPRTGACFVVLALFLTSSAATPGLAAAASASRVSVAQRKPATSSARAGAAAASLGQAQAQLWAIIDELEGLRGRRGRASGARQSLATRLWRRLEAVPRELLPLDDRVNYDVSSSMLWEELPGAPEGGSRSYPYRTRRYTTLDLSPEQLHRIGVVEVERIRGEMEQLVRTTGFPGTFADFLEFLRNDPRFFAETPEDLLLEAVRITDAIEPRLPALFAELPATPFVIELADSRNLDSLSAFYRGPDRRTLSRGAAVGRVVIEGNDLRRRPLWGLEALLLHEAVPGHHLQQALEAENAEIPEFRRGYYVGAFVEGWGLYAESLGLEMGLYDDPYSDFGRLNSEMWRALRLVVDTGLHWQGWSTDRAVDLMLDNSALSRREVEVEVERYRDNAGQALSYKIGEIVIRGLRERAEAALDTRFDVRAFHGALLRNGSVPLNTLQDLVDAYVESASPR